MLTYNPPQENYIFDEDDNVLLAQAIKLILETGKASASLIQRHLKIGYARSARILDQLEQKGIISPADGAKPREILVSSEEAKKLLANPSPKEKVEKEAEPEAPIAWHKTKYAQDKTDHFEINLGVDEKNNLLKFNLEKYGNLLIIGSQFTSAVDLLNNILAVSMATYSPEELRLIVFDGVGTDLIVPNQASHLLTPLIVEPEKAISAFKWSVAEIERRAESEGQETFPKVVILINALNQLAYFSPSETEDNLYRIMVTGRKHGFYFVFATDCPDPLMSKLILANSPAKLVFKPTDKKIARQTGIPESIDLTSPDEAILETMFEGKKKITIKKLNPKEIYKKIYINKT